VIKADIELPLVSFYRSENTGCSGDDEKLLKRATIKISWIIYKV